MNLTRYAKVVNNQLDIKSSLGYLCPEGYIALPDGDYLDSEIVIQNGNPVVSQQKIDARKVNEAWDNLRKQRNEKLSECDHTQLADAPLNSVEKQAWRDYRQELRDLPTTVVDLFNVVWPTKPE